ncbi:MAG: M42 family metallopeptidase [Elusimicrobiota bacterium]
MNELPVDFLEDLINVSSPSGFENKAVDIWRTEVEKYAEEVNIDTAGNCIATLPKKERPRVMIAGHIDEVGFMVKYIDENGYIYFSAVGGVDTQIIPGQSVLINTSKGIIKGVVGKKPIHQLDKEEKKKASKIEDLWIDIGASDKSETEKSVNIGDPIVFDAGLNRLNGDVITGRGFDDKAGAFVVAGVLKGLAGEKMEASLYGVATVQEELGQRGAHTSAFGISPDIGIAVDGTFASDFPTMNKKKTGDIKIGEGPVIARGPNITPRVFNLLMETAEEENIPYQIESVSKPTGTDANIIQTTKSGVTTGLLSIPLRYMHTPVEVISIKDLENTVVLLKEFIKQADKI